LQAASSPILPKITANLNANPTERRPKSAEEKARMDAVLAAIGPPPEWFNDVGGDRNDDDSGDSKDGESGGSALGFSFNSPEGIEMCRPTPGTTSESRMSVGVPDPSDRAATTAKTTARAGKKRAVPCRKGVRVCILQKKLKSAIKIPSAAWNAIEHVADNYRSYGTCIKSSGRGVFKIQFD
jgi:hypothetical protein